MERVAHAFFFSMQVTLVIRIRSDFNGYVFGDFQSVSLQSTRFTGLLVIRRILRTPSLRKICAPTP